MPAANERELALRVVRFLIDRIDEDEIQLERDARRASSQSIDPVFTFSRLRSENIAKRRAIGELQQLVVLRDLPIESPIRRHALSALCAMAVPYEAHPSFDVGWRSQIVDQSAA